MQKVNRKVQGVPHSHAANPRHQEEDKKMTKTNTYKTNKQMHDKQTDQLPLLQASDHNAKKNDETRGQRAREDHANNSVKTMFQRCLSVSTWRVKSEREMIRNDTVEFHIPSTTPNGKEIRGLIQKFEDTVHKNGKRNG